VKIGPTASADDVAALMDRLNPANRPGRLTLIVRMGTAHIGERLPALLDALGPRAAQAIWMTDPMHGNTTRTAGGQKTRVLDDILAEVETFFTALGERGLPPGGLHLEIAPDDVTECVGSHAELDTREPLARYESAVDPRLSPAQAEEVVRLAAALDSQPSHRP
jgi:3-deoxy-7-phosphoheptulonate synthase